MDREEKIEGEKRGKYKWGPLPSLPSTGIGPPVYLPIRGRMQMALGKIERKRVRKKWLDIGAQRIMLDGMKRTRGFAGNIFFRSVFFRFALSTTNHR